MKRTPLLFPLWGQVTLGVGLLVAAASAGLVWYFADSLVRVRRVRRPVQPARVLAVSGDGDVGADITLARNPSTERPGVVALSWENRAGHTVQAELGGPLALGRRTVRRRVRWTEEPLQVGQTVRPSTIGAGTPSDRGLDYREVTVPAEHGDMPCWQVDGSGPAGEQDWVIVTHGYGGLRQDALRILPTFARLGLTSLTITYRNAEGAPRTPERVHRLSAEEWRDLESAVRYARAHGARRVLLMGFSMGGSITLAFLRYSPLAGLISGAILDSPALEWRALIHHHAVRYRLPTFLAPIVARMTTFKSGQDFDAVDHLSVADSFSTPMIVFHGTLDNTVPVSQVDALAQARPDIVEYVRVEGGEHVRPWNIDPEHYEARVERFVRRVLDGEAGAPVPVGSGEKQHV